jgi:hypothetical protein
MTFTGNLIEELMATVERAELRARSDEPMFAEPMFTESTFIGQMAVEPWFASMQENVDYDSKLLGVA